jgi:hypothetical protein
LHGKELEETEGVIKDMEKFYSITSAWVWASQMSTELKLLYWLKSSMKHFVIAKQISQVIGSLLLLVRIK